MNTLRLITIFISLCACVIQAGSKDDPLLTHLKVHQLDYFQDDNLDVFAFEADFWIGKDLNKFWLKTEVEQVGSETEELELQALYSKALYPYWDLQFGVRHDFQLAEERTWAVIGLHGLSPYYFEIDSAIFVGDNGDLAARFEAEYEMPITQQWILSPELEVNFYGQDDPINEIGSGLSDASLGLRLRYEFVREFAFYFGFEHKKKYGSTADFAELNDGENEENNFLVGIKFWF
ncbi:copper resistance protein B [Kangiella sp. HZ709]|uniref:copper resistance protein B n=1 Tax=Kangiella sp. HZ709 TaxID=2666328 RepID=UPI0012AF8B0F|nr:copper resistance protein B [Kangiella sp. HZ709]MRX28150.1 copper resistance protein B [Kangiella sp. HZ709]